MFVFVVWFLTKRETQELQAWEEDLRERETILRDVENFAVTQEELVNENVEEELERRCTVIDEVGKYFRNCFCA